MSTPELAFKNQKERARKRKIEFDFTFEEWVTWWITQLGPNWFKLKNYGAGFVMARWYDDGPYAPHNVKCIRQLDNLAKSSFGKLKGEKHPRAKITKETALAIKQSAATNRTLAGLYNLSPGYVSQIKTGERWKHLK